MSSNYGWIHLGSQKQIWTYDTKKPQYLPHKHRYINYGATYQIVQPTDTIPPLNDKGTKRVQGIVGALFYVGREVNNKLLVYLSAIGA